MIPALISYFFYGSPKFRLELAPIINLAIIINYYIEIFKIVSIFIILLN